MTLPFDPLCYSCARFVDDLFDWHCEAFPDGIPQEIIDGELDHHEPIEGDHGLQFIPKKNDNAKEPFNMVTDLKGVRVLDLNIDGVIGSPVNNSSSIKSKLSDKSISTIMLDINSPGGSVFEGMAILNALKSHPATVHGKVSGVCASIASVILMGCDTIEMTKNSMLMMHMPMIDTVGNADELRREATLLDKMKENIIDAYKSKLKKPVDIESMLKQETWLSPEECKDLGFCDMISDTTPRLLNHFDFSKFKYKAVPELVLNLYDVSAENRQEKLIEDDPEFNKVMQFFKKLFHFNKETVMPYDKKVKNQDVEIEMPKKKEEEISQFEEEEELKLPENVDEEVLKKLELLLAENEALKAKIAELESTSQLEEEKKVEETYTAYVDKLVNVGKVLPAHVATHVESLISRHADKTKVAKYQAMLESLPVSVEMNSHFADKAAAPVLKNVSEIEVEAKKLFSDYRAQGKTNVTLGDCIKEVHAKA